MKEEKITALYDQFETDLTNVLQAYEGNPYDLLEQLANHARSVDVSRQSEFKSYWPLRERSNSSVCQEILNVGGAIERHLLLEARKANEERKGRLWLSVFPGQDPSV